jgi:hypothetical protein
MQKASSTKHTVIWPFIYPAKIKGTLRPPAGKLAILAHSRIMMAMK